MNTKVMSTKERKFCEWQIDFIAKMKKGQIISPVLPPETRRLAKNKWSYSDMRETLKGEQ